jgi:hypothetical protein
MHSVHGSNLFGGGYFHNVDIKSQFSCFFNSKSHMKKNPRLPTIFCWSKWHIIRGFLLWCFSSTRKFLHAVDVRKGRRKTYEPLVGSLPDGSWQLAHAVFEVGISTRRAKIARSAFSFPFEHVAQ